ncbi:MAG: glycosyltransferase family 4 protein [Verrucomicrobiae bacterium]|nr:glycosyltransferase family 4 protein [Verrucomicrobiae bacterium]
MRVLIVYNTALDGRSVSGVQRHFAGVTRHWVAGGHTVDFLVARAAWPVFRDLYPHAQLISPDNWFDATGWLNKTWRYVFPYGWRMISAHRVPMASGYDMIYACCQAIFETYPSRVLARRLGAAFGAKVHHVLDAQQSRAGFFDRLYLLSERWSTRLLNRHADVILCSTPPVAADFARLERRLGLTPRVTAVVGYGLDFSEVAYSAGAPKEFDAVLLGRIHRHKGVFDVPALWGAVLARRPEARLLVIGEGPDRAELERRCTTAGFGDRIHFTGGIADAEKNRLMSRCRVGLSLSREEGWGLSVTECLGFGMPVVAMHLPIFDHVFPGQVDLVPMGDTARAAARVVHWLADDAARLQQSRRGRDFVEQYDYAPVAQAEMEALEAGVAAHRSRRR